MLHTVPLPPASILVAAARPLSYADALTAAIVAMETERPKDAVRLLKDALTQDRNEPLGVLALATLYLQSGSLEKASSEFARARRMVPGDPLAIAGFALSELAAGRKTAAMDALNGVNDDTVPSSTLIRDYVQFISGNSASLDTRYASITAEEPDPLRLEMAAFVALQNKKSDRGESLLRALLARPNMARLQEDSALVFLFDADVPAQGCAGSLPYAVTFPQPTPNERPYSGRATLLPPAGLSTQSINYMVYSIDGGYFTASTNSAPFVTDWNTLRMPNGQYTLRIQAFSYDQQVIKETVRTISVLNTGNVIPSRRLGNTERTDIRRRLTALLTPRASRKAAYFALASRAVARKDTASALSYVESIVAIDPTFHNASGSLRTFNRQVLGPCEGIWKGQTSEKIVALTFDDGPNPLASRTPALIDALQSVDAQGTFFVVGKMVEKSPELVKRLFNNGNEIANHSFSHPNLTYLSAIAVEKELCRTSVIIREITGVRPRFYRPPGGNFNTATVDAARSLGMAGAYWTLDAIRLETTPLPHQELTRYVLQNVRPGSIVLLHNAPDNTIAAIPDIVRGLRERGYTLVTMTELLKRSKPVLKAPSTPGHAQMFDGGR